MRRRLAALLPLGLLLAGCTGLGGGTDAGHALLDDAGRTVQAAALERLVPTSVDLVEVLLQLGHGHRIVAVPSWIETERDCVAPPEGLDPEVPRLGIPHVLNAEQIVAMAPDLVLVKHHPLQPTDLAVQLANAGVPAYVVDNTENLENVRHTYRTVARILEPIDAQAPANAEAAIARFDAALAEIAQALAARSSDTVRALYQFPAALVAGDGTSGGLLLELAGAVNVAHVPGYRQLSSEAVARSDPERLVVSCTAAGRAADILGTPRFQSTTSGRLGPETLRIVDPSLTGLVGPRFPAGVLAVAQWLHPAAFDLVEADVAIDLQGRTLRLDASASHAQEPPLRYRFDPGDGSGPMESEGGRFDHTYADPGDRTFRLLLIDAAGRIHEHRQTLQVT